MPLGQQSMNNVNNTLLFPLHLIPLILLCLLMHTQAIASDGRHIELSQLLKNGKLSEVVSILNERQNKTLEDYLLLVSTVVELDLDDAEDAAEQMLKAYPNQYKAYLQHASVMGKQASNSVFSALGYASKAKSSLDKALALSSDNTETLNALLTFHLAAPSIAGGDMEEARVLVDKIANIDATAGKYAQVRYLQANEQADDAISILKSLSEQAGQEIQAGFQLGNLYIQQEAYSQAMQVFKAVTHVTLPKLIGDEPEHVVEDFKRNQFMHLMSFYRVGWSALKAQTDYELGASAMQTYIDKLSSIEESNNAYPSVNWAKLRLSELLLKEKNNEQAKQVFTSIEIENDDKNFKKLYKKLKKRL